MTCLWLLQSIVYRLLLTGPWMLLPAESLVCFGDVSAASSGASTTTSGGPGAAMDAAATTTGGDNDTGFEDSYNHSGGESANCSLRVLFLSHAEPSPEDELHETGFRFWVDFAEQVREYYSNRPGVMGCLKVEPCFDVLVPDEFTSGIDDREAVEVLAEVSLQVDEWLAEGVRFAILGVDFQDCSITRGYMTFVGLHHIALNVKDWFVFRQLATDRLWGVGSIHDDTLDGFVDLTARSSTRGVCLYAEDPEDQRQHWIFADIQWRALRAYQERGVEIRYISCQSGSCDTSIPVATRIVNDGCDTLIALFDNVTGPAILQQELANLQASLNAEFFYPELNATLWKELGRVGEQVFSATEWRHDATFENDDFFVGADSPGGTADFVSKYRQWLLETSGERRDPTVQEAAAVAAGNLILRGMLLIWGYETNVISFDDPPANFLGQYGLDRWEDDPDQFGIRFTEAFRHAGPFGTFWGTMHFDLAGVNVGKKWLTIQYLQDGTAATVHPREAGAALPVLPMDSFEARGGCPEGTYFSNPSLGYDNNKWSIPGVRCVNCPRLQFQDQFNKTQCEDCPPGEVSEERATGCQQCPPGKFRETHQDCVPCQMGRFSQGSGATQCESCPAGSFANSTGRSKCEVCPPGWVAQEPGGKFNCTPCESGFSTNNEDNQATCTACPRGSYSEGLGSPSCRACPGSFDTENIASNNRSRCLCPPGSYWHKASPDAEPACRTKHCKEALRCSGWSNEAPSAQAGYSVGLPPYEGAEPSYIVLCASTRDCPGDLEPGSCPEGHEDARSCAECKSGYGRGGQGGCMKCKGVKWYVPILLISLCACLGGAVLYGLRFTENNVPAESVVKITAVIGIVLTALQILSVFRFIQVDWPEPIGIFHTLYSTVTDPLVVFSSVGCALSITSAFHNYLLLMCMWPAAAVCIFVLFKLAGLFSQFYREKVSNINIFQMEGILVLLFYTSISMFSLIPWQCKTNPDDTASVVAYRQVLCWRSSEHAGMVVVSCVAIAIFIVGFMSLIAWATYQYPYKVTRPKGAKFLLMFRWIFNRFAPHTHYYGLIYCSRNLLVTVLPVVFVDNIPVQFLLVASILQFSLIFQCWSKPWITDLANKFDAASTVLLILILIVGSLLISADASAIAVILSVFVGAIFSLFGIALMGALVHNVYLRVRPHKEFAFFLCHHKVAAAVLARWVKIELQLRNQGRVFLDSDELNRLDKLFEVVGYETQNFVVLLTNETLSRIWCAGEITTALRKKVRIICIACNDYEEPTDEFISNLGKVWTDTQIAEVSRQGVSLDQIKEAFVQFRDLPKIRHDRTASFKRQTKLIDTLVARGRGVTVADLPSFIPGSLSATQESDGGPSPEASPTPSGGLPAPAQLVATPTTPSRTPPGDIMRASGIIRNRAKAVFTLPNVTGHALDHQRNLMVGNLDDPEAFLVSRVLQVQLQQVLQAGVVVASKKTPEALDQLVAHKPSFLVAVLTAGVLSRPCFAVILAKVCSWETPPVLVPVVADANFTFPDATFWERLESGGIVDPKVLRDHQVSIADVLKAYKSLFLVISKRFSSHGSEKIQWTEVKEVADLWPLSRIYSTTSGVSAKLKLHP